MPTVLKLIQAEPQKLIAEIRHIKHEAQEHFKKKTGYTREEWIAFLHQKIEKYIDKNGVFPLRNLLGHYESYKTLIGSEWYKEFYTNDDVEVIGTLQSMLLDKLEAKAEAEAEATISRIQAYLLPYSRTIDSELTRWSQKHAQLQEKNKPVVGDMFARVDKLNNQEKDSGLGVPKKTRTESAADTTRTKLESLSSAERQITSLQDILKNTQNRPNEKLKIFWDTFNNDDTKNVLEKALPNKAKNLFEKIKDIFFPSKKRIKTREFYKAMADIRNNKPTKMPATHTKKLKY